jgi:hypothetical protein
MLDASGRAGMCVAAGLAAAATVTGFVFRVAGLAFLAASFAFPVAWWA